MGYNVEFEGELCEVVSKHLVGDTLEHFVLADGRILEKANASAAFVCIGQTAEPQAHGEVLSDEEMLASLDEPKGVEALLDEDDHEVLSENEAEAEMVESEGEAAEAASDAPEPDGIIWGDGVEPGIESDDGMGALEGEGPEDEVSSDDEDTL